MKETHGNLRKLSQLNDPQILMIFDGFCLPGLQAPGCTYVYIYIYYIIYIYIYIVRCSGVFGPWSPDPGTRGTNVPK